MTPIGDLRKAGVSIWLGDLPRDRILSGGLVRLIAERDVVGITTNPMTRRRPRASNTLWA
jgi:transaldolase